jgi:hypothetical protein
MSGSLVGIFVSGIFPEWGVLTARPTLILYPGLRQAARSKGLNMRKEQGLELSACRQYMAVKLFLPPHVNTTAGMK